MAEGRFLSKSIAHDWELNRAVSFEADYLFARCVPHLDREGRMSGHPGEVKAIVCPLREEMTPEVIDRCLSELAKVGLVLWYEVDGKAALWFKGFAGNQKNARLDREGSSKLPPQNHPALQRISSLVRSNSETNGVNPPEVKGREGKLREVKSREVSLPASSGSQHGGDVPPPALSAGRRTAFDELVSYVGIEHLSVVNSVAALPEVGQGWARGLLATYGPNSVTAEGVPVVDRPEVLALALTRFATDANRWYGRHFAKFFTRAHADILEQRRAAEKDAQTSGDWEARRADVLQRDEAAKRELEEAAQDAGLEAVDPEDLVRQITTRVTMPKPRGAA